MIRKTTTALTLSLFIGPIANAQDKPWYRPDDASKWDVAISAALTNVAVDIVESEVSLTEELVEGDFEASLSDDLSVSTSVVSASVGYRVLPFLQITARAGLAASESETGVIITGTPTGQFAGFFDGPIAVDGEADLEADGYSLGLGATAYFPITDIADKHLAGYTEFQYIWNRFEDDQIVSEASKTTLGLVYPVDVEDQSNPVYFAGVGYSWLSRELEQSRIIAGETVNVNITQEFENPWSIELGGGFPVSDHLVMGFGAFYQMSGETSAFASLIYSFE